MSEVGRFAEVRKVATCEPLEVLAIRGFLEKVTTVVVNVHPRRPGQHQEALPLKLPFDLTFVPWHGIGYDGSKYTLAPLSSDVNDFRVLLAVFDPFRYPVSLEVQHVARREQPVEERLA